jgi:acyl dehydratase
MPMTWDAFKEGDEIPVLKKKPGVTQLVKYAAGGGDFNPLHHDFAFPQSKAIGSIIVHGRFKYAALGELVSNWLDHGGRIQKISCQYRGMDKPDAEMTLGGKVVKKYEQGGKKLADLELWVKNEQGQNTTPGSATVRIDR